ncbi:MAG: MFS transporter [Eubacteriales bacterium]|nr:MFS transporter [Eubacteriales bacterium]
MQNKNGSMAYFFFLMFIFNMAANFVHPVTPTIIVNLQLNDYMFGLALAAMMLCNFLFSPLWGKMAGYLSSRKVSLICGFGYALGQVFFGLAQTQPQFLLARMFAGVFCGGAYVSFTTYTVNRSSVRSRGANLAVHATVTAVSSSFGYFVGGMIGEWNVYASVWLQVATLLVTSVLIYFGCADDKQQDIRRLSGKELARECNPFAAIAQCRRFMTKLLALVFLSYGLANLGYIAFEQCFNYYLRDQFGLSSGYNGVIKAALGVISLVANGTLCLWILRRGNTSPYIAGVMSMCTLAMLGVVAFDSMAPFIAVNVIFFAFYFISLPLAQNRVAELGQGQDSNLVMASFNAIKSFGSIFGSALAGFIYEINAKLPFAFGFLAFAAATGLMLLFCKEEKKAGL